MPHRVVENKRFLIRHTNRKDDMNIEELRSAFTLSSNFTEKVDYWIAERVKQILHIENPIMTDPVQRLMLFIVPLSSFESGQSIDVANMARQIHLIQPIASSHETGRFILEGFIAHGESFGKDGEEVDYVKLFRSGKIEAVDRHYIARSNTLKMYGFESTILCSLAGYLRALKLLEVSPPFSIRIILDGVQGYTFTIDPRHDWDLRPHAPHEMTRNSFFLPGVLINEWSECDDLPRVMKPIFDAVWNCCNWEGSPNYKGMTYTRQSEWVQVNGK